ncbi:MAG: hypothetical protein ACKPCM_06305 [Pseudanabaena sp.]
MSDLKRRAIVKTIEIQGRKIGKDYAPFAIAEMSGNHPLGRQFTI